MAGGEQRVVRVSVAPTYTRDASHSRTLLLHCTTTELDSPRELWRL